MNVHFPAQRRWASRLAHLAVVIVVLALAAATFVLSYTGVHSIVLQAGVPTRLARIYPGIFDAALVIACAAALMLREGHWWARAYAWLSIILVIAVVGAADAVHAMNVALPHRKTAGVVAAAPWVLVLLGFSLWLTMLRQSRTQHTGQPLQPMVEPTTVEPTTVEPTVPELRRPEATPAEPAPAESAAASPIPEDTSGDEETPVSSDAIAPEEAIAPKETAALQETTTSEEAAPAEVAATAEPVAVAEPEPAPASETPAEEDTRTPEPTGEGQPLLQQAVAENEATDEPGALSQDYWDADDEGESGDEPAVAPSAAAPPAMRLRRVPAIPDEQEEPPPPFATVPRFRRVRSTPTPPEDDEEDQ